MAHTIAACFTMIFSFWFLRFSWAAIFWWILPICTGYWSWSAGLEPGRRRIHFFMWALIDLFFVGFMCYMWFYDGHGALARFCQQFYFREKHAEELAECVTSIDRQDIWIFTGICFFIFAPILYLYTMISWLWAQE